MKKAISAATSAALLASLLATAVAPSVFAASPSVTPATPGSFPQGGFEQSVFTSGASYTFNEGAVDGWGDTGTSPAGNGFVLSIVMTVGQKVHFDTTVAPTISGPGTLGLSGAFINDTTFEVTAASSDKAVQEAFTVSGFKVAAEATAALGAVATTYTYTPAGGASNARFGGAYSIVASGTLAAAHGAGTAISPSTINTGGTFTTWAANLSLVIDAGAANEETLTAWTAGGLSGGTQTITLTTPTDYVNGHLISAPIEERMVSATNFTLSSIGSVTKAAALTALKTNVLPGENNQTFGATTVCENNNRDFATAAVVTITIQTDGVIFSSSPTAAVDLAPSSGVTLASATSNLSFDRKSATFVVSAKDALTTTLSCITISGKYDLTAAVPLGTKIKVAVTVGSLPSVPATVTNAIAGNAIVGTVLSVPTVYIGENDQSTGTIKITEAAVGSFTQGPGFNTLVVCLEYRTPGADPLYTRAPFAVVASGSDLLLRDPATLTGKTTVMGEVPSPNRCDSGRAYSWRIFAGSTTAPATIYLVGSDSTGAALPITGVANGPRISLSQGVVPGGVVFDLLEGDANGLSKFALFTGANAVYRNSPAVAAKSNPLILAGGIGQPGGDITISETAAGQFQTGELVRISVLKNSKTETQEQFFTGGTGGVATTDFAVGTVGSGLVAHISTVTNTSVDVCIDQRAFQPTLGVLTISGFKYTTVADATNGNVLLEVTAIDTGDTSVCTVAGPGVTVGPAGARLIDAFVSNAHVGITAPATGLTGIAFLTQTALGATKVGPFSDATKVAKLGKYETWRFAGGSALVGKTVSIWVATKNAAGKWSAFTKLTARLADSSGNAFFWWKTSSKAWISVRAMYAGDATHFASWGVARQARWI